jgi:hypothetical protein
MPFSPKFFSIVYTTRTTSMLNYDNVNYGIVTLVPIVLHLERDVKP